MKHEPLAIVNGLMFRRIAQEISATVSMMHSVTPEVATASVLKGLETLLLGPQPPKPVALRAEFIGHNTLFDKGAITRLPVLSS